MVITTKTILFLSCGLFSLLMLFMLVKDNNFPRISWSSITKVLPNVPNSFTCQTWTKLSYINNQTYHQCLKSDDNNKFWQRAGIRHTAYKSLLNASSLIIEVGGNRGEDTDRFIQLYNPFIISYEPLRSMWKSLSEKYKRNPKIEIHPYGLGNLARDLVVEPYAFQNEGTSIFRPVSNMNSSKIQRIKLLNIIEVIEDVRKTKTKNGIIDMISINCEGCEFEILPVLISNNMMEYFRIIQFATHSKLLPDASCIYCQIEQALERTHRVKYHYSKIWEGWLLKNDL